MQEYAQVTAHNLGPLGPAPQISDFYHPSYGQKDREIVFRHPGDGRDRPGGLQTRQVIRDSLNFFDVGNVLAMLADELYLAMLEVWHAARHHKIPGPLAHTMIDIAQKSLELWRQDKRAAIRFAAGVLAGPTNIRATT